MFESCRAEWRLVGFLQAKNQRVESWPTTDSERINPAEEALMGMTQGQC
jgi:hypothetical protein